MTVDLIVIGTGTAARAVAYPVRAAGWSVAVIDHRPFGGTCALRGCDPKKMLMGGAQALDHFRRMRENGVKGEGSIDWPALIDFKRTFTDPFPERQEASLAKNGISALHGTARFVGRNTLEVDGEAHEARHIVLAAGAEPVRLGIPGEEHLATNEDFLSLEALPRRIVMVGGGYIAAEFSHIAARAGARVTVLQRQDRMLTGFEPEMVGRLMEKFASIGVDVRCNAAVEAVEMHDDSYRVTASTDTGTMAIGADLVVHAAGRKPPLEELDLHAAGIASEGGRLTLNEYLQSTTNPAVYAAGDAAGAGPPLTPVAGRDGSIVAANLLEGNRRKPDYRGIPSVAFTVPPIASVGMSEAEARRHGLRFRVNMKNASDWFTARQQAEKIYGFKTLVDEGTGRILGAHLVGPHADEVINLFALAIRNDLTAEALKATVFTYPTGASDIESML